MRPRLSVDPGIRHTGWVVGDRVSIRDGGVILTGRRWKDSDRICSIVHFLAKVAKEHRVGQLLVEEFQIFGRARVTKGYMRTAKLQGAIQALPLIVPSLKRVTVCLPSVWQADLCSKMRLPVKGRDKKERIHRKLTLWFGQEFTDHETDALGILLNDLCLNMQEISKLSSASSWRRRTTSARESKLCLGQAR